MQKLPCFPQGEHRKQGEVSRQAVDQSDVKALRPDALGLEIEASRDAGRGQGRHGWCEVLRAGNARRRVHRVQLAVFLVFLGDSAVPFAAGMVGICFSLGLVLVLCCGAELFTGNMLMVTRPGLEEDPSSGLVRNWVIVWLGNLVGSLIVVALIYWCGVGAMNSGAVGDAMVSVAVGKVTPDWLVLMAKGIMCNVMVCLAVWIASPRAPWWTRSLASCSPSASSWQPASSTAWRTCSSCPRACS